MRLKLRRPITPGWRHSSIVDRSYLDSVEPQRRLITILPKKSGRNSAGRVTTRHQGGRQKRYLRQIDWRRDKRDMAAIVSSLEYDPNRTADIALLRYADGQRRYILAPAGLKVGDRVVAGEAAPITSGNALPLRAIPVGTLIHAVEITAGKGAQLVRGAGSSAAVAGFEGKWVQVKLPSGEIRRFDPNSYATIGAVGNSDWKNVNFGKAGRRRLMGIRPQVRGTAQHPASHPHGGGEGRSGEGMHPKTPWGKPARGNRTRSRTKHSRHLIVQRRK